MTSPFVDAMMTQFGSRQTKQYGENGAVEFSTHGVKGDGSRDVEGYLSVAFADILRGTTPASIHSYTDNVFRSKDVTNKDIEDFFALIFHTRECRGDGKGERTAMYHLLFATAHHRPKVIIDLSNTSQNMVIGRISRILSNSPRLHIPHIQRQKI